MHVTSSSAGEGLKPMPSTRAWPRGGKTIAPELTMSPSTAPAATGPIAAAKALASPELIRSKNLSVKCQLEGFVHDALGRDSPRRATRPRALSTHSPSAGTARNARILPASLIGGASPDELQSKERSGLANRRPVSVELPLLRSLASVPPGEREVNRADGFLRRPSVRPGDSRHPVSYTHLTLPTNREVRVAEG